MYTKSTLNRMNHKQLADIAVPLGIEVKDSDTKTLIADAILLQQKNMEGNGEQTPPTQTEAPKTTDDAPTVQETPKKRIKYVFSDNVLHNKVSYKKGDDASVLDEPDLDLLLSTGLVVEYVAPKTKKEAKKAVTDDSGSFKFVRNVNHDRVEYVVGQDASDLPQELKELFLAQEFIQLT